MTSLQLLSGYGSGSESDNEDGFLAPVPVSIKGSEANIVVDKEQARGKVNLPSVEDIFSDNYAPAPVSAASKSMKRPASDAFGEMESGKSSYTRVEHDVIVPKDSKVISSVKMFAPPQLKKPNTVTEDSSLWTTRK